MSRAMWPERVSRGYGDIDEAFARAVVIVKEHFKADRAAGAAIEPRTILAEPGGSEGVAITLWDSTQAPFTIRSTVALALDLPLEAVRVRTPDIGGAFGPKGRLYPEEVVLAAASRHLGKPVLWMATRSEDFATTYQGRGIVAEAELAADNTGNILGLRVRLLQDCGAYLPTGLVVSENTAQHLLGPYRIPAFHVGITGVYTNKPPLTPLRGGGRELGVFVTERILDRLARATGIDPCVVREKNALASAQFPYDTHYPARTGGTVIYDSGNYPLCLNRARTVIGYDAVHGRQALERKQGIYRGVAVTLFLESTGMDRESARAEVRLDGTIGLTVGSPSNGQGHATTMAQICAQKLGVEIESIEYRSGDTGAIGQGTGTFGSRMAVMAGNAAAEAARTLREKILQIASEEIEVDPRDLELLNGFVSVKGSPERGLTLRDLAALATKKGNGELLLAEHVFSPERATSFAGGAHAAIVRVDIETGLVEIERYLVVHDCRHDDQPDGRRRADPSGRGSSPRQHLR